MFMNAKKIDESRPKINIFRRCAIFFGALKVEFKQISWTSRKELKNFTKIVLVSTFVASLMVYVVDLGIQRSLSLVHLIVQRIFG